MKTNEETNQTTALTQTKQALEAPLTAQHTPGPWEVKNFDNGTYIKPVKTATYIATVNESKTEADENAALIAAAPELLAACRAAAAIIATARRYFPKSINDGHKFDLENACATVGKAIAKAEGR